MTRNARLIYCHAIFFSLGLLVFGLQAASSAPQDQIGLPSEIILLPEDENAILVEKNSQTLFVFSGSKSKEGALPLQMVFSAPCSTGEIFGPKQEKGDKKTPEGVYFLIDEYEDRYLAPVYGKKAFPTDYPNFVDRRLGKNGSAIWIHGTDKALKPMDSNGCVAMENENVVFLSQYINLNATPLIIVDKLVPGNSEGREQDRQKIAGLVDLWRNAVEKGSYHEYLSFYDSSYLPDISWWEAWQEIRQTMVKNNQTIKLSLKSRGIYRHGDLFVVIMDMGLNAGPKNLHLGKRKLFIQSRENGSKIIGDVFQVKDSRYAKTDFPLVAAARELVSSPATKATALKTVQSWLTAWSAKNMDAYKTYYAPNFRSEGMSKKEWVERKTKLARRYDYIQVTGDNFKILKKKEGLEVRFLQNYKSSGFSTKGVKQLKLVNIGGAWKISQENWKGK